MSKVLVKKQDQGASRSIFTFGHHNGIDNTDVPVSWLNLVLKTGASSWLSTPANKLIQLLDPLLATYTLLISRGWGNWNWLSLSLHKLFELFICMSVMSSKLKASICLDTSKSIATVPPESYFSLERGWHSTEVAFALLTQQPWFKSRLGRYFFLFNIA